ncbi:LytTR family transcriptional regulator DNA-binding domain-containing protein [uncultured Croceitalea sp.]|uniref:LytTR family transcriptional regulator DNA-binding domain-containing protein n=1 Tax=uncultured Croceitalea sp. TaxID=1798908 RepID=UPI00374EC3F2
MVTVFRTMERLEKIVNPQCFFRRNRKMSVNIAYIYSVEDYFNNRLKIRMQKKILFDLVVSRNRIKEFKIWLKGIS